MNGGAEKTFCEFFAGIGLVQLALQDSGWRCVYANDIAPGKEELFRAHFGDQHPYHLEDVWKTDAVLSQIHQQPRLATASFPCTDMSLAGRRKGFSGGESSAFFGFAEVLKQLGPRKPELVLLENVPGFLTAHDGADFRAALETLADLGYWLDAFMVDAIDFVPQSRLRLFVVGMQDARRHPALIHRDDNAPLFDDRWRRAIEESTSLRPPKLRRAMENICLPTGWATLPLQAPVRRDYDLAAEIDFDDAQQWWESPLHEKHMAMLSPAHAARLESLRAAGVRVAATAYRRIRHGEQRMEVRFDGVAGCLRTPRGGSARQIVVAVEQGRVRLRWMSPLEYARLQGAGEFKLSEGVHKMLFGLGDAVCTPVIRWIDHHVLTPLCNA